MSSTYYFSYFPKVQYDYQGYSKIVTDVLRRVAMRDLNDILNSTIYYKYTIKENEKPEDIAQRYYGDTIYTWIVLYANNIINFYAQWPRNHNEFEEYIVSKYGSVEYIANKTNEQVIHHYEDGNGNWITKDTWVKLPIPNKTEYVITLYDYEYNLNEAKREIYVIKVEYIRQIIEEINKIFNT